MKCRHAWPVLGPHDVEAHVRRLERQRAWEAERLAQARVIAAIMGYLAPDSKQTFAETRDACAALRECESKNP